MFLHLGEGDGPCILAAKALEDSGTCGPFIVILSLHTSKQAPTGHITVVGVYMDNHMLYHKNGVYMALSQRCVLKWW